MTLDGADSSFQAPSAGSSGTEPGVQVLAPPFPVYTTLCISFYLHLPICKMDIMTAPPSQGRCDEQTDNADKALSTVLSWPTALSSALATTILGLYASR